MPQFSIVIPVLNEQDRVPALVERLHRLLDDRDAEIIFVDGGSTDQTLDLLHVQEQKVISADRGRAHQLHAGAKLSRGNWLVFVHADTDLPDRYFTELDKVTDQVDWGFAPVAMDDDHPLAQWVTRGINWRSRAFGVSTGDQTLFVRRSLYDSCGGFAPIALMEDIELAHRLRRYYSPAILLTPVKISPRKWQRHGYVRTVLTMWFIQLAWRAGVSPNRLHRWYYGVWPE